MKTTKILLLCAALFISVPTASHAITNTVISVSGTNVVLSWPSYGYESYLIQYRHTFDSTDSWSTATNAYPANGTNQTTFTVVPELAIPGSDSGTNGGDIDPNDTNNVSTNGDTGTPGSGFYRVYHIPDWLADFSGYTFDGPTFIPVDYATPDAPEDHVDSTTVLINGQPTDDTAFTSDYYNGQTNWGMGIYFDRFPNGTNTIQLLTTVRQSDTLNDQTPYMVFSNAPQTITISNFVTYTNWSDLILSNTYTFNAQSSETDVDWEIDIYDVYNNWVNSQTGHSDDGNISWTWDLTDYNGDSRLDDSDPFFYPYITITASSGDPAGWMPPIANQFPSIGDWTFAYMDHFYDDGTTNYPGANTYYSDGVDTMEGGPEEWSIPAYDYPIKYGKTYSQSDRNDSWNELRYNYLDDGQGEIRNFYYSGHGSANSIGGDFNALDVSNNIIGSASGTNTTAFITAQWVHDNVTYNKSAGATPFRFVFLDGCNTADGGWPSAWGVPKQSVSPDWYKDANNNPAGFRPNAFVGWDVTIGGNKSWGTVDKFWEFRKDWMANWAGTFQAHLDDALHDANFIDSNWIDQDHFNHLKEYGYKSMMFQEYNHRGDWP